MEPLIPITGYAKTYEELCNKVAESGEYYNVLDGSPFMTYHKLNQTEIGPTGEESDVLGWYQVKAELESNVTKPKEGDVYLIGISAPYTRMKAQYVNYIMTWVDDGEEEKKIVKNYKTETGLNRSRVQPEEGIYYTVGEQAPYKVYGVVSTWEPVGVYISYCAPNIETFRMDRIKHNPGEIAFVNGIFYYFTGPQREGHEGWKQIEIPEPMENIYKHVYKERNEPYKIREGIKLGTLELYSPKE